MEATEIGETVLLDVSDLADPTDEQGNADAAASPDLDKYIEAEEEKAAQEENEDTSRRDASAGLGSSERRRLQIRRQRFRNYMTSTFAPILASFKDHEAEIDYLSADEIDGILIDIDLCIIQQRTAAFYASGFGDMVFAAEKLGTAMGAKLQGSTVRLMADPQVKPTLEEIVLKKDLVEISPETRLMFIAAKYFYYSHEINTEHEKAMASNPAHVGPGGEHAQVTPTPVDPAEKNAKARTAASKLPDLPSAPRQDNVGQQ